jgi:hypothetical protein
MRILVKKRITTIAAVLALSIAGLFMSGCPANVQQRQQAAAAAQNISIIVGDFQQGEIASYNAGLIPEADHIFIQKEMVTVATLGKTADSCILVAVDTPGVVTCLNSAANSIDKINSDGGLYLKSDKAKTTFQLAMIGVKTTLTSIASVLGGTK